MNHPWLAKLIYAKRSDINIDGFIGSYTNLARNLGIIRFCRISRNSLNLKSLFLLSLNRGFTTFIDNIPYIIYDILLITWYRYFLYLVYSNLGKNLGILAIFQDSKSYRTKSIMSYPRSMQKSKFANILVRYITG